MTAHLPTLRTLFIGGPGRSGTSFVADRLSGLPGVASFRGVELKFFTEKNGLLDLWLSLGEHYSPNRAVVAMQQFRRFAGALLDGQFGQPALSSLMPAAAWRALFERFAASLEADGHPSPVQADRFDAAARDLVRGLHVLALGQPDAPGEPAIFVEKTPHALLAADFLTRILPGSGFLHVMRDPRSIARSLRSMNWGPDDLDQCCAWVASYCRAWTAWLDRQASPRPDLKCLHIEDVAADPVGAGRALCGWLGLGGNEGMFQRANPQTLNGWAGRCTASELDLLTDRLSAWVAHFGYDPDRVGCRPEGASGVHATIPVVRAAGEASLAAGT